MKGNYVACGNVGITFAKRRVGEEGGGHCDKIRTEQETRIYYSLLNGNGNIYIYQYVKSNGRFSDKSTAKCENGSGPGLRQCNGLYEKGLGEIMKTITYAGVSTRNSALVYF